MTVAEIWASLEVEVDSVGFDQWLARRLAPASGCDLRIAIDRSTKSRTVLIRLESALLKRAGEYPRGRGFEVREVQFPGDDKNHKTLAVVLTDRAFLEIFSVLAQDLTDTLSLVPNDSGAVTELFARLRSWQRFMECASWDGLTPSLQSGLYGELYFLRHHLFPAIGVTAGLNAWHGPSMLQQDFQFDRCAVEIKASTSKQHQVIWIASERQLDESLLDKLFLFHLSLDSRPHQGETLLAMVNEIRSIIEASHAARDLFARKLLEAGYVDAQSAKYKGVGYTVRESQVFDVEGEFPRIRERELRAGVGDVTYSISVSECKHYAVQPEQMLTAIKGAIDGR